MRVTLSIEEQKLAKFLARRRHETSRQQGKENLCKDHLSEELSELDGVAGELAYCKLMNVYPDIQAGSSPDEDCILHNGKLVDVKTTAYDTGKLVASKWKGAGVDLYALMVGSFPTYRFAGVATKDELINPDRLTNLGTGELYVLEQKDLECPF